MIVKVRIINVIQVRMVLILRRLRFETPRKKAATKAFQWLISAGLLWVALLCKSIISSSNLKKMMRDTMNDNPIIKKARMITIGL